MDSFGKKVNDCFLKNNWRMTRAVRFLSGLLSGTEKLLTVHDLQKQLKEMGLKANITTIYRILSKLEAVHLVHQFEHRWRRCTYPENTEDDHHFLICEKCDGVEEIFLDYKDSIADQLAHEKNFLLKSVHLGFLGTCHKCHGR